MRQVELGFRIQSIYSILLLSTSLFCHNRDCGADGSVVQIGRCQIRTYCTGMAVIEGYSHACLMLSLPSNHRKRKEAPVTQRCSKVGSGFILVILHKVWASNNKRGLSLHHSSEFGVLVPCYLVL